jgi:hypothetical protein
LTILITGSLFVLGWASDVGYMSTAGELLLISFAIDVVGITVAIKKMNKTNETESNGGT